MPAVLQRLEAAAHGPGPGEGFLAPSVWRRLFGGIVLVAFFWRFFWRLFGGSRDQVVVLLGRGLAASVLLASAAAGPVTKVPGAAAAGAAASASASAAAAAGFSACHPMLAGKQAQPQHHVCSSPV